MWSTSNAINRSFLACPVKRNATFTILLYTLSYLFFSLPNFINYIVWSTVKIRYGTSSPVYNASSFMKYYSWLLTDTVCVVLVATVNPLILVARTRKYRLVVSSHENNRSPALHASLVVESHKNEIHKKNEEVIVSPVCGDADFLMATKGEVKIPDDLKMYDITI